jgi:hypothetical protein
MISSSERVATINSVAATATTTCGEAITTMLLTAALATTS